ncbi:hypothetical protein BLS_009726 [Venturia inaequalis]|uniref:Tyrosinase copper-binding domain-containing protein n=1 Tax=Venturia inaequalis TaxID=5025 RepID=A0A8H3V027_VENIN|nr:hypothetical protein BLS_009726 [Venturia inaequalis]
MASNINGAIHHTGVFLSWHRYALSLWEDALRDECGWRGGLAYWDWHRDTPEAGADWLQSPLFDTVSGYGGNGQRVNASAPAGGIAMSDLFNSINDPLFFPHHAGLDRVWALWQEQDPKRIMDAGEATGLSDTSPMTLDSWFWVGFAGKDRQTVEVMDALNRDGRGVVCYKYEGNTFDSYFK